MEKMELILEIENAYNKKMEFVENSNTRFSDLLADKSSIFGDYFKFGF